MSKTFRLKSLKVIIDSAKIKNLDGMRFLISHYDDNDHTLKSKFFADVKNPPDWWKQKKDRFWRRLSYKKVRKESKNSRKIHFKKLRREESTYLRQVSVDYDYFDFNTLSNNFKTSGWLSH